jgi:hypothetical protein
LAVGLLLCSTCASAVAFVDRFNHTSTLLPDNTLLVTGGQTGDTPANATNSVQQVQLKDGGLIVNLTALNVARTSHTATLLANGDVLIAGGINGGGAINSFEVYSPKFNCTTVSQPLGGARYDHTATLLKDINMGGRVLLCGGFDNTPSVLNTCVTYTQAAPLSPAGCGGAAPGVITAGALNMGTGRAIHTATLLKDGRVFLTGGLGQPNADVPAGNRSLSQYVVTSEMFNPSVGGGFFTDAHALIEERAFHTATMMGNGQVLIIGGLNATNNLANLGFLTSTEIYDPISDSIAAGPHVQERKMSQSAVLDIGGAVHIFGGLGNYATSYFNASTTLSANPPDSFLTSAAPFTVDGVEAWGTINGGAINLPFSFQMTPDPNNISASSLPSGMVENGQVLFSTPSITFNGGIAYLTPATLNNNLSPVGGVYADMTNTQIVCLVNGVPSGVGGPGGSCGHVIETVALSNLQGSYYITPLQGQALNGEITYAAGSAAGSVTLSNAINTTVTGAQVTAGNLVAVVGQTVQATFPVSMAGATFLYNPTVAVTAGTLTQPSSFTVTIAGANGTLTPIGAIGADGTATFELALANITGSAVYAGAQGDANIGPGAVAIADAHAAATLNNVVGNITYVPSLVDVSADPFTDTFSTFVIDDMMFGDEEVYDPGGAGGNSWFFEWRGLTWKYSHTATLTPFGDISIYGGAACGYSSNCADGANRTVVPNPFAKTTFPLQLPPWTGLGAALNSPRANHTSTVLPSGLVLNAGGTNGPNILATTELIKASGVSPSVTYSGSMALTRDLHTATLLTNGRVLVAGGFTTTGSTGTTATAEIFFANTQTWFQINSMNQARENHAAVLLGDGRVLVTGGYANGAYMSSCEIYDPITGIWTVVTPMNVARALHQATLLQDGRVLVTGGVNQQGVLGAAANGVEIYNPTSNAWDQTNPAGVAPALLPQGLYGHRATLLFDGRVLVSGGDNGAPGETTTSLLYDPAANAWSNTNGPLSAARLNHAATLLPDGIVMVSGGAQAASGNAYFGVETFNLSASSWTSNGNLLEPRAGHTMVLLPTTGNTGNVLAIGGAGNVVNNNTTLVQSAVDSILFEGTPDGLSAGFPPSTRLSSITAVDENPFDSVSTITLQGVNFQGGSEGNGGGAGSANSEQYMPRVVIQALESSGGSASQGTGGFGLDLTPQLYTAYSGDANNDPWTKSDSSLTIAMPPLRTASAACTTSANTCNPSGALLPYGWYQLRTGSNAQYSDGFIIQHGPALLTGSAAPVALSAITANTVSFTWTAVPGALGYDIYWSTNGVFVSTTAGTTFSIGNLSPGTTVGIIVAGFNLSGDGPLAYSSTFYTLPVAPTNVQIASVTASSLVVEWSGAGNQPGTIYEVSESTDVPTGPTCPVPGSGYNCQAPFTTSVSTPVPTLLQDTTVFAVIQNLTSATTYYFRVQAYNEAGQSSGFGAQPPLYVSTVTRVPLFGVTATTETTTLIGWSWIDAVPALNVPNGDHYKIYNATTAYALGISTYAYFLDAVNSTNTPRQIAISAVVSGSEGPLTLGSTVYTLSAVPSLVSPPVTNVSTGSLTIVWGAGGNPLLTQYDLVVTPLLNPPIAGTTVTVNGFNTTVQTSPAPPGTPFYMDVYSVNGNGLPSAPLVLGTTETLASPPLGLTIAGVGTTSITVNWNTNGSSIQVFYEVTYTTDNFATDIAVAEPFLAKSNVSTFTITGLQTGTTYSIRVRGENLSGTKTAYSNYVTTAPLNGGGQPTGLLEGVILAGQNNDIQGYIGVGPSRYIDLNIPIGALPVGTQVTISTFLAAAPPCGNPATTIGFQVVTNPLVEPTAPLFLTMGYTAADIPLGTSLSTLQLERYDQTGVCVPIPTTFNVGAQELTAEINHLSLFQVGGVLGSTDLGQTVIFPNPFYPSRGQGYVTFENMPPNSHVRIYTPRGELVSDSYANNSGLLLWGGINQAGRSVASGVYIAVAESGGSKRIFKVVVVR